MRDDDDHLDYDSNSDLFNMLNEYSSDVDCNVGIFPQSLIESLFVDAFDLNFVNCSSLLSSNNQIEEVSESENIWFNLGDLPSSPSRRETTICPSSSVIQLQNSPQTSFVENFTNDTRIQIDGEDDFFWHFDDQLAQELMNAPTYVNNLCEQLGGGLLSNEINQTNSLENVNQRPVLIDYDLEDFFLDSELGGGYLIEVTPVIKETYNKKWNAMRRELRFTIANREVNNFFEANDSINNLFEQIFASYIAPIASDKQVQYIIEHDTFDIPITSGYINRDQLTSSMLQNHFEDVFQSRKKQDANTFQDQHSLIITLNILPKRQIRGGSIEPNKRVCKEKKHFLNMKDLIDNSRFIHVVNSDNYCLVRAILIGKAFFDKEKYAFTLIRKNNRKLNASVKELVDFLKLPDEHLNLTHVKLIEDFLIAYRITIYDSVSNGSRMLYPASWSESFEDKREKFIDLCFEDEHFNVITKMTSFYSCSYFCQYCKVKYSNLNDHDCEHLCGSCKRYDYKCKVENLEICNSCNLESRNETCKNLHDSGQCFTLKLCQKCNHLKSRNKPHVCESEKWCPNCKSSVDFNHKCFIRQTDAKKYEKKFGGFIWFDIECFVNEENYHEANLIMAKRKCANCLADRFSVCDLCGEKYAFRNIQAFVEWCMIEKNKYFTFISHNGKSYDNYFIMRYFQRSKTVQDQHVDPLVDGLKVLTFRFRTLTFKDSSLFIQSRLESFTKIFGIQELKKGFFPHDFNRKENFDYKGLYPDKDFYKTGFYDAEKKKEFDLWYDSVKEKHFDFAKELEEYCWSDVELLAEGCLRFGDINLESSKKDPLDPGIHPFKTNLTISSYCNTLFRRNFMPKDSIPWIPANGYNPNEKTSKKAEQWLKFLAVTEEIYIQHSKNGGEKKIGKYKVDGYCEAKKRIYEFQGNLIFYDSKNFQNLNFYLNN